jgi:hypothetical protein
MTLRGCNPGLIRKQEDKSLTLPSFAPRVAAKTAQSLAKGVEPTATQAPLFQQKVAPSIRGIS